MADEPVAGDPAPSTMETTAPVADPAPVATEPVIEAAPATAPTSAAKPKTVKTANAKATARPAAGVAAPTAVAAPAVAIPEAMADPVVTPVVEPTAAPLADDSAAEIAFGGALALLVLGGGAVAMSRRRKSREVDDEREFVPINARSPDVTAAPVAERSAFDWGQTAPAPAMAPVATGGSAIERARRGPTPDNPSLSLKKRLKRATFFEQRDREIAAGKATPIDNLAGLPKKLADAAQRRPSTAEPKYGRVLQPA